MSRISRLSPHTSILFLCDIQVKFAPLIHRFPTVVSRSSMLLQASNVMEIPKIVSEQYPQAFGPTVPELTTLLPTTKANEYFVYPKKKFSMLVPECVSKLGEFNRKQVLLCGIEAHVCVSQTAFDLIEQGFEVHVVCDAVSSQRYLSCVQ